MWWADLLWGFWNGITAWIVLIVHVFGGWDQFPFYNAARSGNWYDSGSCSAPALLFSGPVAEVEAERDAATPPDYRKEEPYGREQTHLRLQALRPAGGVADLLLRRRAALRRARPLRFVPGFAGRARGKGHGRARGRPSVAARALPARRRRRKTEANSIQEQTQRRSPMTLMKSRSGNNTAKANAGLARRSGCG